MVRALGYVIFVLGLALGVVAGFVLSAAFQDFRARGCPGPEACTDPLSIMVLMGCALVASAVMLFAGVVFVRR